MVVSCNELCYELGNYTVPSEGPHEPWLGARCGFAASPTDGPKVDSDMKELKPTGHNGGL